MLHIIKNLCVTGIEQVSTFVGKYRAFGKNETNETSFDTYRVYQIDIPSRTSSIHKNHTVMTNNKRIQKGEPLEKITISQGPSKFELMLSVFNGKKVPIALKEANEQYPTNLFDAHFYSAGSSNTSNHYLNYQCTHSDNGSGLLSNEDVPWLVKVAIVPHLHPHSYDDMVHYEGIYDAIKREGVLTLITEKEAVLA